MYPFRRIFVADLSATLDVSLLKYGANIASLERGTQVTVAAVPSTEVLRSLVPAARSAFASCPGVDVACRVLVEPDVDSLFKLVSEAHADLLLVRHPHRWPDGRLLARRIVTESPCSVWMVPDGVSHRLRRVAVDVGQQSAGHQLLRLACALGREARTEALLAIEVRFASLFASLDELRERTKFELSCLMARMEVGDMECSVLVEDSPHAFRALRRTASEQRADLLVTASPEQELFGNRQHIDDLISPSGPALLGVRLPRQNFSWRGVLSRVFSSEEFPFN